MALLVPIKTLSPISQFPDIFTPGEQVKKSPILISWPKVQFKFIWENIPKLILVVNIDPLHIIEPFPKLIFFMSNNLFLSSIKFIKFKCFNLLYIFFFFHKDHLFQVKNYIH